MQRRLNIRIKTFAILAIFILLLQLIQTPVSVYAEKDTSITDDSLSVEDSSKTIESVNTDDSEGSEEVDTSEIESSTDLVEEPFDNSESLAVNEEGVVMYNGKPLYVGKGDDLIPAKLDELMKEGVKKELTTGEEDSLVSMLSTSILSFLKPSIAEAASTPVIKYNGQVKYGQSIVGDFTVNGEQAFCFEHAKSTPASGTPYGSESPYNNAKIQRALYYGWDGPENVFSNRSQGIVITSQIVSRIYSGSRKGESLSGYDKLWNKVQNGSLPNDNIDFSDTNLSVAVKNGKQVSQTTEFESNSSNEITIRVPSGITIVNETTGKTKTNGSMLVKGGERVHLEASMTKKYSYNTGNLSGKLKSFQPLIVKPDSSGYQVLGFGEWYTDPDNTASFKANFVPRTVKMTVKHVDSYTGNTIKTDTSTKTIGSSYKVCPRTDLTYKGHKMIKLTSQTCKSGTVPTKDFTVTFKYNSQHKLTINYYDDYSGKYIKTKGTWTHWADYDYTKTVDSSFTHGNNDTSYKIVGTTKITGTMPRGNKTVNVYYTPSHKLSVLWQNRYPANDVFRDVQKRLNVGASYKYTQPSTFTLSGDRVYDRENSDVLEGVMGYKDVCKVFYYKLRRGVTVKYLDNRTDEPIKDVKKYDLNQGDKYEETHPTIKNSEYTYRYVKHIGDSEKGTIQTSNIKMTYLYDIPLVKVGLKKIQIYTAKSDEGLPVKVELSKVSNYDASVADMSNPNMPITVALYQGTTRIDSNEYTANEFPEEIDFTIPESVLEVDEHKAYTVKIEGYDTNDFHVVKGQESLTTDGYTSSEKTIKATAGADDELFYKGVVMTEREVGKSMKVFNETLTIPVDEVKKMKTGYGFEMPLDLNYTNDISNSITTFSFNMLVPEEIVDESYLNYMSTNSISTVPLEETEYNTSIVGERTTSEQKFELQHVNVEKITGNLFSDEQVTNNDNRIENDLIDGYRRFYLPIWGNVGEYDLKVKSKDSIGINQIDVEIDYNLDVVAHMYLHMDSETKEADAIHFEPVNQDNPFPNGVPDNWTESDVEEFKEWLND